MPSTDLTEKQVKLLDEAILKVFKEPKKWYYLYTDTSNCIDFSGPDGDFSVNLGSDWYKHIIDFSYRSYNRNAHDSEVIRKAREDEAKEELKEKARTAIKKYRAAAATAKTKDNIKGAVLSSKTILIKSIH